MRRTRRRDILEPVKVTDIVWTCDRCKVESILEGPPRGYAYAPPDSTPDGWTRVPGLREDAAGRPIDLDTDQPNPNDRFYCEQCWERAKEALKAGP